MATRIGSPRMVEVVGELRTSRGTQQIQISREFREWLLGLWRRTGGDGDAIDSGESTANTTMGLVAGMSARLADVRERVETLEADRAFQPGRTAPDQDQSLVYQVLRMVSSLGRRLGIVESSTVSAQASIQFKDEGSNIGSVGTVTAVDFVGSGVTASESGGTVTVSISGGGGGGGSGNSYFPGGWG